MTHGAEVPNACGLFGGYPGSTVVQKWTNGAAKNGIPDFRTPVEPFRA